MDSLCRRRRNLSDPLQLIKFGRTHEGRGPRVAALSGAATGALIIGPVLLFAGQKIARWGDGISNATIAKNAPSPADSRVTVKVGAAVMLTAGVVLVILALVL